MMPEMDGITFLKTVRASYPHMPFILLTGEGNEDVVIEALNNGADYYLQKDGDTEVLFAELSHHIRQAAEKRRTERALQESEEYYRTIFENSGTAMAIVDENWLVSLANSEAEKIFGYISEEIEGKIGWDAFVVENERERLWEYFRANLRSLKTAAPHRYETEQVDRWGNKKYGILKACFIPKTKQHVVSITDITDLMRAEEEVRQTQQRMMNIIDFLPDATFVIDKDRKVIAWNQAIEVMTGVHKDDIIGKGDYAYAEPFYGTNKPGLIDIIVSDDEGVESSYDYVKRKNNTVFAEAFVPSLYDGKGAYLWGVASPLFDAEGDIVGAIETIRDVTRWRLAEKELLVGEERLNFVIEGAYLGFWDRNMVTGAVVRNKYYAEMLGYSPRELDDNVMVWEERVHPDDLPGVNKARQDHLDGKTPYYEIEHRLKHRDGQWVWVYSRGKVMERDVMGSPLRMTGIIQDLTERKKAENALHKRDHLLSAAAVASQKLLTSADHDIGIKEAIVAIGLSAGVDDVFVFENFDDPLTGEHLTRHRFGWSQEMATSMYSGPVILNMSGSISPDWYEILSSGKPIHGAMREFPRDVQEFVEKFRHFVSALIVPIIIEDHFWGIIGFGDRHTEKVWDSSDISILRLVAESIGGAIIRNKKDELLREAHDDLEMRVQDRTVELEAKNAEMERFVYTISHDLRSPLVTIQGFVGFLKEDTRRGDQEKIDIDLQTIEDVATKMDRLLGETLELSRIGRVANLPEDVSFGSMVKEALDLISEEIKKGQVEISVARDWPVVCVDHMRIVEVLINLVENSIKYMGDQERPSIDIGHQKEGEKTVFFVQDNGMGIGPDQHSKVFDLFYKIDNRSGGVGAGLAIVKRIINVHGGRIWIESDMDKGCKINFTLPCQ
ncbi:MAG: PAS domain S-box protein [Methanothrix sp.]|nr:MAG: PAS domain S-box protein [Methanothrix sp.]